MGDVWSHFWERLKTKSEALLHIITSFSSFWFHVIFWSCHSVSIIWSQSKPLLCVKNTIVFSEHLIFSHHFSTSSQYYAERKFVSAHFFHVWMFLDDLFQRLWRRDRLFFVLFVKKNPVWYCRAAWWLLESKPEMLNCLHCKNFLHLHLVTYMQPQGGTTQYHLVPVPSLK